MSSDNITMKAMKDYFNKPSGRKGSVSKSISRHSLNIQEQPLKMEAMFLGAPEFVVKRGL